MATRKDDPIKRAVRGLAFAAFMNGAPLPDLVHGSPGYEVHGITNNSIMVRVAGTTNAAGISSGPRYFEVRA